MRIRHLKPGVPKADMPPLIGMTFQFIVFFVIVSGLEQLYADDRAKPLSDGPHEDDIVVNVGFLPDSEEAVILYGDQSIPVLDSAEYFQRERTRQITIFGEESLGEVTIVIRAARTMSTGLIQEMIRIALEAGFTQFLLMTENGEEEQPDGHGDINLPIDLAESPDDPPAQDITVRLTADEDGSLQQLYFGQAPLGNDSPACFKRLNNEIAGFVGAGGLLSDDDIAVEIDAAYDLDYEYTVKAVSSCLGRVDPATGRIRRYMRNIRFKPQERPRD